MASVRPTNYSIDIPEELSALIFEKLPLKTLGRLQCVCKPWNSFLSSPFFNAHHFKLAAATTNAKPIHLRMRHNGDWMPNASFVLLNYKDTTLTPLHFPLLPSHHQINFFSVIHGVVCLVHSSYKSDKFIAFWNPTIRKYVAAPFPWDPRNSFIGVGFDASENDFKAVTFIQRRGEPTNYYVLFSARKGEWTRKRLPEFVSSLITEHDYNRIRSCFVNGAIHWITRNHGRRRRPHGLLVYECEKEEFRTMELPEEVWDLYELPRVFVNDGLLSVLTTSKTSWPWGNVETCKLWTMKEYGVASTWTEKMIVKYRARVTGDQYRSFKDIDYKEVNVHAIADQSVYVFEESLLLMDIGNCLVF